MSKQCEGVFGQNSCGPMPCLTTRLLWVGLVGSIMIVQLSLWCMANTFTSYLLSSELSIPSRQESVSTGPPFRMLLGIFTMGNAAGKERRDLIRQTYLALPQFLEQHGITNIPLRHARVCSLDDYWRQAISQPEQCQLLYTFVLGAATDPNAPVEYLVLQADRPMIVNMSSIPDAEPDITYLNIRENMNFGKTNTWFKYASKLLPESLHIDIIAKVDTDCLVHPNILLEEMERRIPPARMIYGGSEIHNDKGHHYMQGGFYFLSRSLADTITIGRNDRWNVIMEFMPSYRLQRPEDVETGQLVKHYGGDDVFRMDIPENFAYVHNKKLKEEKHFLAYWNQYGEKLIAQNILTKIQNDHRTNCPSREMMEEARLSLPTISPGVTKRLDEMADELIMECQFLASN